MQGLSSGVQAGQTGFYNGCGPRPTTGPNLDFAARWLHRVSYPPPSVRPVRVSNECSATGRLAEELMRVMGVDPGLTRCGLSVVEHRGGRQIIALDVDVVRTPANVPLPRRLLTISEHVEHWLDTHHPDVVAIERVFSQQNVSTVMGTAQAGGIIALAAAKTQYRRALPHPQRGQGRGHRQWRRRQSTGHRDGHQNPWAASQTDSRRRRRRVGAGDLSLLARADDRPDGRSRSQGRRAAQEVRRRK